MTTLSK